MKEVFRPRGFIFDDVFVCVWGLKLKWPQLPKATALSLQADVTCGPTRSFPHACIQAPMTTSTLEVLSSQQRRTVQSAGVCPAAL
jgi:hypothetical protein